MEAARTEKNEKASFKQPQSPTDALLSAVYRDNRFETRKAIASGADARSTTSERGTPVVVLAAMNGCSQALDEILTSDHESIDFRDPSFQTPLLWAVRNGHEKCAGTLLSHGADPNVSSSTGQSPLHAAAVNGKWGMAGLLLCYGADPNAKNQIGESPIDWALRSGDERFVSFLRERANGIR